MGNNTTTIRVYKEDKDKLMGKAKEIFIKKNPVAANFKVSEANMFKRVVQAYCDEL